MTAKELAARLGSSEGALSQAINGNPTLEKIKAIAEALEVPVAQLFDYGGSLAACPHCGKPIHVNVTLE